MGAVSREENDSSETEWPDIILRNAQPTSEPIAEVLTFSKHHLIGRWAFARWRTAM